MKPIVTIITAAEDQSFLKKFLLHAYSYKAKYDFKSLGFDEQLGSDISEEATRLLQQTALVIIMLSVDVMADDAVYALASQAITEAKRRGVKVVGIEVRSDVGCHRDLWKRIGCILLHNRKPVDEIKDADEAWCGIVGQLRQVMPAA